jgi:hypothetical protein
MAHDQMQWNSERSVYEGRTSDNRLVSVSRTHFDAMAQAIGADLSPGALGNPDLWASALSQDRHLGAIVRIERIDRSPPGPSTGAPCGTAYADVSGDS